VSGAGQTARPASFPAVAGLSGARGADPSRRRGGAMLPPMSNSLWPLLAVAAVSLAAVMMIRPGTGIGADGPEILPGILRLPNKEHLLTPSMPGELSVQVAVDGGADTADWHRIVLGSDDRHPFTHAFLRGTGEHLVHAGRVVLFDPAVKPGAAPATPLPIHAESVWAVARLAGDRPALPGQPATGSLRVVLRPALPPTGHPAADLLPDGPAPVTATVSFAFTGQTGGTWPQWYAAVGRATGKALLDRLALGASATRTRPVDWGSVIPEPPVAEEIRWRSAFVGEFVRGYIGGIDVPVMVHRDGATSPAVDRLAKLLGNTVTGRGAWRRAGDTALRWERDHADGHITLTAQAVEGGWTLVFWQERPRPGERFLAWVDAAKAGDLSASASVAAHIRCARLPADLRRSAAAALGIPVP
jgi:hypothetical protein